MAEIVLLDSHVLFWVAASPKKLTRAASRAFQSAPKRHIADITLRELAWLHSVGRIELPDDPVEWFTNALQEFDVSVVPIDARIATQSTFIAQNFHGDPADQLIAATAIELNVPVITADERLRKSPAVRTIW